MSEAVVETTFDQEYAALRNGAVFRGLENAGVLILSGQDRADFLHRMTSNNINALAPGDSAVTVLTSPTARIVYTFTVVCREDNLLLLPAVGEAEALLRHLRGQIFFMDQVTVENASDDLRRLRLMGPNAGDVLAGLEIELSDAADNEWTERDGLLAVKQITYDVPGFELIIPVAALERARESLLANGAARLDSDDAYQIRRIELGRPAPGSELVEEFNPLETGLLWACPDNKGCYTGQEIIARQITYDKVSKTLVGLRGGSAFTPGAPVSVAGRNAGVVTSAAYSPSLAAHVALAVVKRPHNESGSQVEVSGAAAEVMALPFVEE